MIAANGDLRFDRTPVELRIYPYFHARLAAKRHNAPDQHWRAEHALVLLETRSEIGDFDRVALLIGEHRYEDGGVLHISLLT